MTIVAHPASSTSAKTSSDNVPDINVELAVTSFHQSRYGNGILLGTAEGQVLTRVLIERRLLSRTPEVGETWRIQGEWHQHPEYGGQIRAAVALPLVPRGESLRRWLVRSKMFPGIGPRTVAKLWGSLGDRLYDALLRRDTAAIAQSIGWDAAITITDGFGLFNEEVQVLAALDRYGVDPRVAMRAAAIWGSRALARLQEDPYVLRLLEHWKSVDTRALSLGVGLHDERRLKAAAQEALDQLYSNEGHTAATEATVLAKVAQMLGASHNAQAAVAVRLALESRSIVTLPDGRLQARGPAFMESEVRRLLGERLKTPAPGRDPHVILKAIERVEIDQGYRLGEQQREAVFMALTSQVSILSGLAGSGKTSVVKCSRSRKVVHPPRRIWRPHPSFTTGGSRQIPGTGTSSCLAL